MKKMFRVQSLFPTTVSKAITIGQTSKNEGAPFPDIAQRILEATLENLSNEDSKSVGYAGFKVIPTLSIAPTGNAITTLDLFIHAFSRIITNDVLEFIGATKEDLIEELAVIDDGEFEVIEKTRRKKPVVEIDDISDELRDELSGKNIVPGEDDDDCGDNCKI